MCAATIFAQRPHHSGSTPYGHQKISLLTITYGDIATAICRCSENLHCRKMPTHHPSRYFQIPLYPPLDANFLIPLLCISPSILVEYTFLPNPRPFYKTFATRSQSRLETALITLSDCSASKYDSTNGPLQRPPNISPFFSTHIPFIKDLVC